jgi:hypothetical protein
MGRKIKLSSASSVCRAARGAWHEALRVSDGSDVGEFTERQKGARHNTTDGDGGAKELQ